jgi:hypothetical protein
MIVANIRNGYAQHDLSGLFGLGCADCKGKCNGLGDCPPGSVAPEGTVGFCTPGPGFVASPVIPYTDSTRKNQFCPDGSIAPIGQCGQEAILTTDYTFCPGGGQVPVGQSCSPLPATGIVSTVPDVPVVSTVSSVIGGSIFGIPVWLVGIGLIGLVFIGGEK